MAGSRKKLPIGVDIFEKLIREDYYYLDKTTFIRRLVDWRGEVNLFTRPRRFGKTLIMSMPSVPGIMIIWKETARRP